MLKSNLWFFAFPLAVASINGLSEPIDDIHHARTFNDLEKSDRSTYVLQETSGIVRCDRKTFVRRVDERKFKVTNFGTLGGLCSKERVFLAKVSGEVKRPALTLLKDRLQIHTIEFLGNAPSKLRNNHKFGPWLKRIDRF